jgi:nucleoside-diphosphate-sugar epimerase
MKLEPPLHRRRVAFFTKSRAFDISKARSALGYAPQVSIREGVARTASWYAERGLL